uniref:Uncharacterized protein n=1 Tax=Anguilla anguilla TaxID=7936 RepID=A0A0E9Q2L7_ANGAN
MTVNSDPYQAAAQGNGHVLDWPTATQLQPTYMLYQAEGYLTNSYFLLVRSTQLPTKPRDGKQFLAQ